MDLVLTTTTIDPTNRMIVKIYCNNDDSSTHNITWYTEGTSYYSFVKTSVSVPTIPGPTGPTGHTGPTGATGPEISITNSGDNRIITSDGATGVIGESNLTFDGTTLGVTGNIKGSSSNTINTNALVQSSLLFLSNNT